MRTLSRPMFNMGGPIKQGIMHGIREPYRGGQLVRPGPGRPGYAGKTAIAKGIFSKVGKLFGGDKGWWSKIRPTGKFRRTTRYEEPGPAMKGDFTSIQQAVGYPGPKKTAWEIAKSPSLAWKGIKENPYWSGAAGVFGGPAAAELGVDIVKGPVKNIALQAADLAVPDWLYDQDKHLAEIAARKKAEVSTSGEPIVSQYLEGKGKLKELTGAQKEKWADAQRGKRLNNLLDIMGYDRSKKTAVADALIDASKIVSDRGTLDTKNITGELINPAIQALSKRLDKPEQIREAVGLMMAKGEIEKDLYKWKPGTALKNAQDMADTLGIPIEEAMRRQSKMSTGVGEELMGWSVTKKAAPSEKEIEQITRNYANANKEEFREVISTDKIKEGGLQETDSIEIVQGLLSGDAAKDDGYYQVGKEVIKVTNGVPKKQW
jgi:hypothetical protein